MQFIWFTAGKNWPQTGGFGPWMTTADDIPDPQQLTIKTVLNGREVQNDTTASMVHPVAKIIEYISAFSPLSPGDVIITGSPLPVHRAAWAKNVRRRCSCLVVM